MCVCVCLISSARNIFSLLFKLICQILRCLRLLARSLMQQQQQ